MSILTEQKTSTNIDINLMTETSYIDQVTSLARFSPDDEIYSTARKGVEYLVESLIDTDPDKIKISSSMLDAMIARIDEKLSAQMDSILHDPKFQELESAWRSLRCLIDKTNFEANNQIHLMNVTKAELFEDFDEFHENSQSGLFKNVYNDEFGQFGGEPFGSVIANYTFSHSAYDMKLLGHISSVCAMSHLPFIAGASPAFFGIDSFAELPYLKDIKSIFEMPQYSKWNTFRSSEDARYIGLTAPRVLMRLPYDPDATPVKSFKYKEDVSAGNDSFLWGQGSFLFGSVLNNSFAENGWCANIIGPNSGGLVGDLPLYSYESMGEMQTQIPTEILISERREFELAELGFISLVSRKNSDQAAFFSANSIQKSKFYGHGENEKQLELDFKLGTQFPYIFIVSRLAQYIKLIQRENIGSSKERSDIQNDLNNWIKQYVVNMDNPSEEVRSRKPLRSAEVLISDIEGEPGWYQVALRIRPHFKYMGASFTLSLVGKLEKK